MIKNQLGSGGGARNNIDIIGLPNESADGGNSFQSTRDAECWELKNHQTELPLRHGAIARPTAGFSNPPQLPSTFIDVDTRRKAHV